MGWDSKIGVRPQKQISINHGTDTTVVLTADDLNKIHVFENTSACTVTLMSISASDIGSWIEFRKKGAGNLTINRTDSDTIAGSDVSITNTNLGQTYAFLKLKIDGATNFGFGAMLGDWVTSAS